MKVHHNLPSSYFTSPPKSKPDADADESARFTLPDEPSDYKAATSPNGTGGASFANSISSAFWMKQSGAPLDETPDEPVDNNGEIDDTDAAVGDSQADRSSDDVLSQFINSSSID